MLTDEERRKIYGEEKARIEAQEELKRKPKTMSKSTSGGCLLLIALAVALVVICQLLPSSKTHRTRPPSTSVNRSPDYGTSPIVDSLRLKHPDWSLDVCRGIEKHGVWSEQDDGSYHGMTHEQLTASWGNPSRTRHERLYVSFLERNSDEQWVYDNKPWVTADDGKAIFYFQHGVLVGWRGIAFDKILFMNAQQ